MKIESNFLGKNDLLTELNFNELLEIQGGGHFKDFLDGVGMGLTLVGFGILLL